MDSPWTRLTGNENSLRIGRPVMVSILKGCYLREIGIIIRMDSLVNELVLFINSDLYAFAEVLIFRQVSSKEKFHKLNTGM